ncbi:MULTISPECIES: PVC-type heme-binding CxxCH protein [unclassified Spirosoma]|uniref:PVC-type heme-binding CxxCH protein n=1 Tax=unclassified Spirosoma TaxID=2621999 RepID=UPI000968A8DE|nr:MULTISPECIES: PVC-type heme-binding CxxCH protein [unclassified Spirosoma]MBN8824574.1 c-type cytochrome [Spirosoma sp.]OJW70935.1 MAG: dehydrogenase [Spirosoma sp. 48-14]
MNRSSAGNPLLLSQRVLRIAAASLIVSGTFIGAFQNRNLNRASGSYLNTLFAQLNDDDKHDPKYAVGSLNVANGLEATLFAAEPMLTNPTNIDVDARGRVWVCEAYNYRPAINGNPTRKEGDRIVILEDTNGDGKADLTKVFYQDPSIESPLGIWVQGNKVIISDSPNVWVLTDENGDDKADKKELLFTGIGGEQHDHGMHTFVFGPDGKWYFNFGNEGGQLLDKDKNAVVDMATGKTINKQNFKQGMVFRCDPDGKNVEVLGQNFRNNYEIAVDSYGTLWQSDNDDDGNKGVRINYVMEYGNYGYTDEMTGAGWQANRDNIEPEIPRRHWHLNDPGVVPNLLQTGAGSPTGIIVYEGNLLPEVFRNQVIHCDAGPNVVRSYTVQKEGAGYKAQIVNVLEGARDQWFRPADICVAPDGSLIIADWYDPGVGGHQAGDQNRGRVYRVAPPNSPYTMPKVDVSTTEGAIDALQSPNMAVRYAGWQKLHSLGSKAEKALAKLYKSSDNARMQARALWLLSQLNNGKKYIETALKSPNPDLRITGLRAARERKMDIIPFVKQLVNDPDAQVRRESILALRRSTSPDAPALWAQLASKHDGNDRWYLEALGIGADGNWDSYYAAWLKQVNGDPIANAAGRDIVWRARTKESVPLLAKLAGDPTVLVNQRLRYFRAFDFNPGATEKSTALLGILQANSGSTEVTKLALRHLDPAFVRDSPVATNALAKLINDVYGTPEYLELITRFEPVSENNRLKQLALAKSMDGMGRDAARQLLKQGGAPLVWEVLNGSDAEATTNILTALRRVGNKESINILKTVALDTKRSASIRKEATRSLGGSMEGADLVLDLLKSGAISGDYKKAAAQGVSNDWRKNIRQQAASYLDGGQSAEGKKLPGITELLAMKGDAAKGVSVFKNNCSICHQVNGEGMDFGPKLSEIGSKLPREGQYLAILHPDAGISFGFEGWEVKFKDGSSMTGIVSSKTETDLQMKFPGGVVQNYKMADVVSMKQIDSSMMPSGLQEAMSTQELVDLVEYLTSLKKK